MPQLSLFPKFCASLSLDELPGRVAETGLDAVNLLIRPGYWVSTENALETAPRFVQTMRRAGLAVDFCTWCALPAQILAGEDTLRLFADLGIKGFRLGYYTLRDGVPLSVQLREANEDLQRIVPMLERYGLRAVFQIHHENLVNSTSLAALLMEGLPDQVFGVMLDVGNQGFEGMEYWSRAVKVLGPYWSALGVKDTTVRRIDGVPEREWSPCQEGDSNWADICAAYAESPGRDRDPWVLMPFYHEDDVDRHLAVLHEEVAFIRRHLDAAQLQ